MRCYTHHWQEGRALEGVSQQPSARARTTQQSPKISQLHAGRRTGSLPVAARLTPSSTVVRSPASAQASTSASAPASTCSDVTERSEPTSAQFVHDYQPPTPRRTVDDYLEPFTGLQLDSGGASCSLSRSLSSSLSNSLSSSHCCSSRSISGSSNSSSGGGGGSSATKKKVWVTQEQQD